MLRQVCVCVCVCVCVFVWDAHLERNARLLVCKSLHLLTISIHASIGP